MFEATLNKVFSSLYQITASYMQAHGTALLWIPTANNVLINEVS